MYEIQSWKIFIRSCITAVIYAAVTTAASTATDFDTTLILSEAHHQVTTDDSRVVWPWRSYRTSRHTPPELKIVRHNNGVDLADGYIFLSPADSSKQDGTYDMSGTGFVMDSSGDLIFAGDEDGMGFCEEWVAGMTDFRAQEYQGRRYITYWNGCNTRGAHWGHRWGRVTFIDEEYNKFTLNPDLGINTLEPATRGNIDVHEHQMTDRDTIVVTSYNNTQYDLTSIGGPADAWVADGMFLEIDPKTQDVLFEWRALEHLDIKDSRYGIHAGGAGTTQRVPWDWLHINSVQRVGENYLISARHHWAVYLISGKDGSVIWKLDGINGGDFGSIPVNFRWQHHARAQNVTEHGMTISLFNNMVNGPKNERTQTNGLAFWLALPPNKHNPPMLIKKVQAQRDMIFSGTQGSFQMELGNGNSFIGYGTTPVVREFGPGGNVLWQARFGEEKAVQNYRGFKMPWSGTPKHWDPVVVYEDPHRHTPRAYVSWNGATEISWWAVFAGEDANSLESIGVAQKKAFETLFSLESKFRCIQVGAIRDRKIIRKSNIACLPDVDPALTDDRLFSGGDEASGSYSQLLAENERLRAELDESGGSTWAAYQVFAEGAMGAIGIVLGVWSFILIKDWWKKRRYQPVEKEAW